MNDGAGLIMTRKICRELAFEAHYDVETGILEMRDALQTGVIRDPYDRIYRNVD